MCFEVKFDSSKEVELPTPNVNPHVKVTSSKDKVDISAQYYKVVAKDSPNPLVDDAYNQRAQDVYAEIMMRQNKPRIPNSVVRAVSSYTKPEHKTAIKDWLKSTSDLNQCDEDGNTVAHLAALNGKAGLLKFFVKKGVNPNYRNLLTNNVLLALLEKLLKSEEIDQQNKLKIFICIKVCLELKVETEHPLLKSAMTMAVFTKDLDVVKLLVENNVSVNQKGILGYPLSAAKLLDSNPEIIDFLEHKGAKENDFDLTAGIKK